MPGSAVFVERCHVQLSVWNNLGALRHV